LVSGNDMCFNPALTLRSGGRPQQVILDDANRDGRLDVFLDDSAADTLHILTNSSEGFEQAETIQIAGPIRRFALADVDLNSQPDVVVASTLPARVLVHLNVGAGENIVELNLPQGSAADIIARDLDNDTRPDIVAAPENDRELIVWRNVDAVRWERQDVTLRPEADARTLRTIAVDIDGDLQLDILVLLEGGQVLGILNQN
jgi:hypothetical protein